MARTIIETDTARRQTYTQRGARKRKNDTARQANGQNNRQTDGRRRQIQQGELTETDRQC